MLPIERALLCQLLPRNKKIVFINDNNHEQITIDKLITQLVVNHCSNTPVFVFNFLVTREALFDWLTATCGIYDKLYVVNVEKHLLEKIGIVKVEYL